MYSMNVVDPCKMRVKILVSHWAKNCVCLCLCCVCVFVMCDVNRVCVIHVLRGVCFLVTA